MCFIFVRLFHQIPDNTEIMNQCYRMQLQWIRSTRQRQWCISFARTYRVNSSSINLSRSLILHRYLHCIPNTTIRSTSHRIPPPKQERSSFSAVVYGLILGFSITLIIAEYDNASWRRKVENQIPFSSNILNLLDKLIDPVFRAKENSDKKKSSDWFVRLYLRRLRNLIKENYQLLISHNKNENFSFIGGQENYWWDAMKSLQVPPTIFSFIVVRQILINGINHGIHHIDLFSKIDVVWCVYF